MYEFLKKKNLDNFVYTFSRFFLVSLVIYTFFYFFGLVSDKSTRVSNFSSRKGAKLWEIVIGEYTRRDREIPRE